ncbi:MAG: response regulator transcription factor [bacterium]
MENKEKTKILIVDDHPLLRAGIAQVIQREVDLIVCAEAATVSHALEEIEHTKPDLLIVDLSLEDGSGLDLIDAVNKRDKPIPVLVISMHDESMYIERAFQAGAKGYLLKRDALANATVAIRKILKGDLYASDRVLSSMVAVMKRDPAVDINPGDLLTEREMEVFRLIGQGYRRGQIAEMLHVSAKTVETHFERMKSKLGFKTTAELSQWAVQKQIQEG